MNSAPDMPENPGLLRRIFTRAGRARNQVDLESKYHQWAWDLINGIGNDAGIVVTPNKIAGLATVYACQNVLSRTLASLPVGVFERSTDTSTGLRVTRRAEDHPVNLLLSSEPNEFMTPFDLFMTAQGHLTLRGNAFMTVTRRGEDPLEIIPQRPEACSLVPDKENSFSYEISGNRVARENVIHARWSSHNGVNGCDLTSHLRDVFGLAVALEQNASKFFANSSRPGFTLMPSEGQKFSAEQRNMLKASIEEKYGGTENAYRTMVLSHFAQIAQLRTNNNDSQFDESRDRQDKKICAVLGVPPHKVGIQDNMPRANVEEENISFVTNTILPLTNCWKQAMAVRLLKRQERAQYFIDFDLTELLKGDTLARFQAYAIAIQNGFMTQNEVRERENLNPMKGADILRTPLNMSGNQAQPSQGANLTAQALGMIRKS